MNWWRLFCNETRLLSRSNLARVCVLLIVVLGVLGVNAIENANQSSLHNMSRTSQMLSLGEARYAATGGAAMFAMLTLFTLSRDQRKRSRDLLEASHDYTSVVFTRIAALLGWACLSTAVSFVAGWILHFAVADTPYEAWPYVFSNGTALLPALAVSVLLSSGLYLAFASLDVAFLAFGVVYVLGVSSANYLYSWVQTNVSVYSDFAGIDPVGRFMVYNRVLWICAAATVMLVGLLIQRHPGYGVRHSLVRNSRGGVLPVLTAIFAGLTALVHMHEPYLFPQVSFLKTDLPMAENVWLRQVHSRVFLYPQERAMAAEVRYSFENDSGAIPIRFVTNTGLEIQSVQLEGQPVAWTRIPCTDQVQIQLPPRDQIQVDFTYRGTIRVPSPAGSPGYIGGQSTYLLEACAWLFQPLTRHKERIEVSGEVVAPQDLTVVAPGNLESVEEADGKKTWSYQASAPHLQLGLFAADYRVEKFRAGDVDVEFYFSPRHEKRVRDAKIGECIGDIVGYYQEAIGPYPFDQWPIKVVEAPLYKPGGHSSLNVVTIAEYVFNRRQSHGQDNSMALGFHELKLIAHEIAHQWWGTGVMVPDEQEWTSEGLVEHSAYRYASSRLPEKIAAMFVEYWKSAIHFHRNSYHAKNPEVLQRMRPEFIERFKQGERKVQVYSEMPLKLVKAEELMGTEEFSDRLVAVYHHYQGRSLSYGEFLSAMGLTREVLTVD